MLIVICFTILIGLLFSLVDRKSSLIIILFTGLILRIIISSDLFLHNWDERFHAVVAKNIMLHPLKPTLYEVELISADINDWTKSHIWLSKPPLTFWIVGTSLKLFGHNEFALRAPSIMLGLISVYLTYLIGLKLYNRKIGLLSSFLHSIHGLSLELNGGLVSSDHVDTLFLCLFELAIYLIIHSINSKNVLNNVCIGAIIGLAYLTKWTMCIFIIILMVPICIQNYKKVADFVFFFMIVLCSFFLVALPWNVYLFKFYPVESSWMFGQLLTPINSAIQGHEGGILFYLDNIRIIFAELIYLILIWAFVKYKKLSSTSFNIILAWIFVPLIILSIAETKRYTYVMMSAPSFFILTAIFIQWVQNLKLEKYKYARVIALVILLGLPIRYSLERIKPFKPRLVIPAWRNEMKALEKINIENQDIVLINEPHYMNAMFYFNFIAYENDLSSNDLVRIKEQGYIAFRNIEGKYHLVK